MPDQAAIFTAFPRTFVRWVIMEHVWNRVTRSPQGAAKNAGETRGR